MTLEHVVVRNAGQFKCVLGAPNKGTNNEIISLYGENEEGIDVHYYIYSMDEVRELLESVGFIIEELWVSGRHLFCMAVK